MKNSEMRKRHSEQMSVCLVAKDEGSSRTALEDTLGAPCLGLLLHVTR